MAIGSSAHAVELLVTWPQLIFAVGLLVIGGAFIAYNACSAKGGRALGSASLWWRHCCSGDCCVASRRELAMVLDTASHRLGRVSHLPIPLAVKAGEVVIAPPYDRLQRTARYGVPGAKCGSAPAEPERRAMQR